MRMFFVILIFPVFFQENVPLLTSEEYSYELEYFLKSKDKQATTVYDIKDNSRSSSDVLPFVKIHFTFPSFRQTDKKVRVYQGAKIIYNKNVKNAMKMTLDMGFAVDLKEGTVPSVFRIYILGDNKQRRGQIKVEVKENGELLINEVVSGMI